LLWRIIWGPRLRGSRRDGLLYGLLNYHGTRRPRSGLLSLLASTNEPGDEKSNEKSDEESDKRPHSNPHDFPPAPPYVGPSSPHGAITSSIVVNEVRLALLRRRRLLSCRVNRGLPGGALGHAIARQRPLTAPDAPPGRCSCGVRRRIVMSRICGLGSPEVTPLPALLPLLPPARRGRTLAACKTSLLRHSSATRGEIARSSLL
jgi:hypothetical protein